MNKSRVFIFFSFLLLLLGGCKKQKEDLTPVVEAAMQNFVATLQRNPPTSNDVSDRTKVYLSAQPDYFFGSTVAVLDANGVVTTSPYWYRKSGGLLNKELSVPSYNINTQDWLRKPIDTKLPYWTAPYFDAGGGEIWMKTYSYPIVVNNQIVAVATTDLAVDQP